MVDVIEITLKGIGYAMFNMTFVFGIWIIYVMNKRLNRLDYYRTTTNRPFLYKMSDVLLEGIIVGIITSLVLVFIGVPLLFNEILLLLIPISLILSTFRIRMLCITYSASVLAVISFLFNGSSLFGQTFPNLEIHTPSLIILVGLLHLIEGALVFLTAHRVAVPVLSVKENSIIMGHIMQKSWLLPLSILIMQMGMAASEGVTMPLWWPVIEYAPKDTVFYSFFPLIGMLSYSSIAYVETPKKRAAFAGSSLMGFGALVIVIGVISVKLSWLQLVGALLMLSLHEGLYLLERQREDSMKPIYTLPKEGIRIMQIIEGGLAEKLGMKKGDVIEKINDTIISDIQHFISLIKVKKETVCIVTKSLAGKEIEYLIDNYEQLENIGIRVIPEKPLIIYPYNQINHVGLFEFLHRENQ